MTLVAEALHALALSAPRSMNVLSSDSLQEVRLVILEDDSRVICKVVHGHMYQGMLACEQDGLRKIAATHTIRVPSVHGLVAVEGGSVLVMEFLPEGPQGDWAHAGGVLAAMHAHGHGELYGTDGEFFIGRTRFQGGRDADWCQWLATYCLTPLLQQCRDAGHVTRGQASLLERVVGQLHRRVPCRPTPALVHGDLWRGNMRVLNDGTVALLDPACMVADPMVDLAMAALFGGVPSAFQEQWLACRGDEPAQEERIAVGQLLHLLNHVHLFGRDYVSRVLHCAAALA